MATYIYETLPARVGEPSRRFEVKQSMNDAPLERDPETGQPVRRVISGGFAPLLGGSDASAGACAVPQPPRHGCGPACGCASN